PSPSPFLVVRPPPRSTPFPYTTLFRSADPQHRARLLRVLVDHQPARLGDRRGALVDDAGVVGGEVDAAVAGAATEAVVPERAVQDRKSTRLNSSHVKISYAVFCLKKKN